MIENNICQRERLEKLNIIAKKQLQVLVNDKNIIGIQSLDEKTTNNLIDAK